MSIRPRAIYTTRRCKHLSECLWRKLFVQAVAVATGRGPGVLERRAVVWAYPRRAAGSRQGSTARLVVCEKPGLHLESFARSGAAALSAGPALKPQAFPTRAEQTQAGTAGQTQRAGFPGRMAQVHTSRCSLIILADLQDQVAARKPPPAGLEPAIFGLEVRGLVH